MRRIPVRSTERNIHNNLVAYNRNNIIKDINIPSANMKAKAILKIILIVVSVVVGTGVCLSVVYYVFIKKKEEDDTEKNNSNDNSSPERYIQTFSKSKISYKCTDILANCKECKELSRNLASKPGEETPQENNAVSSIVCTSCADNYYPLYNEDNVIIFCNKICETGNLDFCKTCDEENQNQCGTCNYGYYIPSDDMIKAKCKKCDDLIDNCEECYGSKKNIICKKCNNNFFLNKEKNVCEPLCETGPDYKCKTCNKDVNKCNTCNSGYYLPLDDDDGKICKKCSDNNDKCQECSGTKNSVKCLSCKSGFIPFFDKNNEILDCNLPCSTGSGNLCKLCDYEKNQCINCNAGYYLPSDDIYKLKCKKCTDIVKNCNECHGELYSVTCDDFINENNNNTPIKCGWNCETGMNEKCLTCNSEQNQCQTCNEGYYLPTDDNIKLECKKCHNLIEYCLECSGSTYSIICTKCMNDYILTYDQNKKKSICKLSGEIEKETENPNNQIEINKPTCVTGPNEKCLTCDYEKNICSSCNLGYYLPSDDEEKIQCRKCSLENCQTCEGTISSNICKSCLPYFTPVLENNQIIQCKLSNCQVGPEGKCKTCHETENLCASCNVGYKLVEGECKLNHSFRATYYSESPYQRVFIIHTFSNYIKLFIADGEEVGLNGQSFYNFPEPGIHEVYVLIEIPKNFESYDSLFNGCENLLTIHFTPLFNTSVVTSMDLMFEKCVSLTSIDVSVFDTKKVTSMSRMFSNCKALTSIDITNFNTTKVTDMSSMFSNCYALSSIDLTNLKSTKLTFATAMFAHCHSLTSIDFSNVRSLYLRSVEQLFEDCPKLKYVNLNNVYTDQVTSMERMFRNCSSLTSVDLSLFSTNYLKKMDYMFEGCSSLTSIDLWQFKTNGCTYFSRIFNDCIKLKYINIASCTFNYREDIFKNVPNDGTIIVHPTRIQNAETYLSGKGWNIEEATKYKE